MIEVLLLLLALVLIAACGVFVAAEFAFVTVDRNAVEAAAEAGEPGTDGVRTALRSLSTQLSGAQVGITVTNLLIGFLAEPSIAKLVDGPLEGIGLPAGAADGVAIALALVLATTLTMLFGELVPKNLAIAEPLRTARAVQAPHRLFTAAARPIIGFCNEGANRIVRRLGVEPQEELASARSAEELSSLVRRSAQEGTLEGPTARLLVRSLAFGNRQAHDVMTPRERMIVMRPDETVEQLLRQARETGRSRYPVLERETDDVVGVVHIKDAMSVPHAHRPTTTVASIARDAVLVPESLALDELLPRLRAEGFQLALVVNEFGGVDGLVTLEDLVEEIVGEVRDEHDPDDDAVRRRPDGSFDVSGLLRPDEIAQRTGVRLPEDEDYETVAGLIAKHLERVPETGDAVTVALLGGDPERPAHAALEVLAVDGLRVDRVLVAVLPPAEDEEQDA